MEALLNNIERQFRTLAENAPDNIARYDSQCRFLYCNPQLVKTLGMAERDLLGKSPNECFPDGCFEAYQSCMMKVIETGNPGEVELILPDIGKGMLWHHVQLVAERDDRGKTCGVLAIGRDITERKKTEQRLHEQEQAIRAVVEHSPDHIVRYDSEFRRIYVNPALQELFGLPLEEILGTTPREMSPLVDDVIPILKSVFGQRKRINVERSFLNRNGATRWVDLSLVPEFGMAGDVITVLSIGRDITERKQLELEMSRREKYQRTLLDNFPYFVWLKDTESRLLAANTQYARVAKVATTRELEGKTDFDFFPHDLAEKYVADDCKVMAGGVIQNVEEQYVDENNVRHWMETWKSPVVVNGEVVGTVGCSRDITGRKLAEQELKLKEYILDHASEGIYIHGPDFRFVYVNHMACESLGYSREELLGMTPLDFNIDTTPEQLQYLSKQMGLGSVRLEARHRRRDGTIFPVELQINQIMYDGKMMSLAFVRDISERKAMEDALAAREREFRTLAENSPDIIIRYGKNLERIYVNPAYERSIGLSSKEALQVKPTAQQWSGCLSHSVEEYLGSVNRVMTSGVPVELSFTWERHSDKAVTYYSVSIVPEYGSGGSVCGALTIGRNITARKLAEDALRASEEKYRTLIQKIQAAVVVHDDNTNIVTVNPTASSMFGIPEEQLIGKNMLDPAWQFFHEDGSPATHQDYPVNKVLSSGKTLTNYIMGIRKPGEATERWMLVNADPIFRENAEISHVIVTFIDVTELKEAKKQLEESHQQLCVLTIRREEAREEERKRIARDLHDELGQRLTALRMNVSLLRMKHSQSAPDLIEDTKHIKGMIDDIIHEVRNVASKLRPSILDMGIVSAMEWQVEEFMKQCGVNCELNISLESLHLDNERATTIFRIVQESLTNIIRHADAKNAFLSLTRNEDGYLLEVRDDGMGFDPERIEENTFGLMGIKERVLMLGGTLLIASSIGEGTSITVKIPIQESESHD